MNISMASRALAAAVTLMAWTAFSYLDHLWTQTLLVAVRNREGRFGEIYGPLTFFRPLSFWIAIGLTVLCMVLMLWDVRRTMTNRP